MCLAPDKKSGSAEDRKRLSALDSPKEMLRASPPRRRSALDYTDSVRDLSPAKALQHSLLFIGRLSTSGKE